MSVSSSSGDTDDYSYGEEIKDFINLANEPKLNLEAWNKASLFTKSNKQMLKEEMQVTIDEVRIFVQQLEGQAKMRKFRRKSYGSGEWSKLVAKEKYFTDALQIGGNVMTRLLNAIALLPEGVIEEEVLSKINLKESIREETDPARRLALESYDLVTRFARVLEGEGIPHNYPIPKPIVKPKVFRKVEVKSDSDTQTNKTKKNVGYRAPGSRNTSIINGSTIDDLSQNAGAFLRDYSERYNLEPVYNEISAVKTVWQQEYIYTCKLGKFVGEGKAKKRSTAKQIAAAQILRQILTKSKKNNLPDQMKPLNEEQMKEVLSLTCEYVDYGAELQAVCSQENARPPIYTPLMNKPSSATNPFVEIRCKALGFNAVGYGKDKEVAKRLSAKLILDQLTEDREKSIPQNGVNTTKIDWIM